MQNKNMKNIIKKITEIKDDSETSPLKKRVAEIILDAGDDKEVEGWINDLLNHGCQSGMVSELIYYKDTKDFYMEFSQDIDWIVEEMRENGVKLEIKTPITNWLAWFGFEETAREIAQEIGMEV